MIPVPNALKTAILKNEIEIKEIYKKSIEIVEIVEPKCKFSYYNTIIEFFNSDFGFKVLIISSGLIISGIIIHCIISYYYKTTYTEIYKNIKQKIGRN